VNCCLQEGLLRSAHGGRLATAGDAAEHAEHAAVASDAARAAEAERALHGEGAATAAQAKRARRAAADGRQPHPRHHHPPNQSVVRRRNDQHPHQAGRQTLPGNFNHMEFKPLFLLDMFSLQSFQREPPKCHQGENSEAESSRLGKSMDDSTDSKSTDSQKTLGEHIDRIIAKDLQPKRTDDMRAGKRCEEPLEVIKSNIYKILKSLQNIFLNQFCFCNYTGKLFIYLHLNFK
jgi:hypothetical protein